VANWIAKATANNKGTLRKTLGAKKGKPIPEAALEKAENSKSPKTRKRAMLAETLKKLKK
jgi:hypothetical protein